MCTYAAHNELKFQNFVLVVLQMYIHEIRFGMATRGVPKVNVREVVLS